MPSFACKDMGMTDDWKATAKTEGELLKKIKEHAGKVHNIKDMTPEMVEQVKKVIKK